MAEFQPGQIVCVKSNPSIRGAVVGVRSSQQENRFEVFIDGATQTFYASQLQAADQSETREEVLSHEQFRALLTVLQIKYPGLSTLYSLKAARIAFIPYQFRPVLRFIRSDHFRLLIADSVGVGKTIEAGLILRELQARREINSVLIVCPRPLVTEKKWQNEMRRFDERFTHLDGPNLRHCINEMDLDGVWPERYQKVIIPYSLFDRALLEGVGRHKGLRDLDPPPRFDLVIVDEAHHIRNQDTFSHQAVRFFCDSAAAAVFLTATPIQLGSSDLFVLLNTLRPDLVIDRESFNHMAEPNPFINKAVSAMRSQGSEWQEMAVEAFDQAASTPWGHNILRHSPNFNRVRAKLLESEATDEERVKMISDTEEMHTFAGLINRTRRRDIGDFTIRKPETVDVPFTPEQEYLHNQLLMIQAEIFHRLYGQLSVKFLMTTIRRQAASCLLGLAPFLEDILNRRLDELSWNEADDTGIPDADAITHIQAQIQRLLEMAAALGPEDPKLDALRDIIRSKQTLPNNKVMLFSSFLHTLRYLHHHLRKDGFRVGLIHGGTPDEDRVKLRARFEMPKEEEHCLDLLLFSEIGCEGLDYQFCDCIVNYDIPWNPMRIEQRIGRIDRQGQKSESVAIVNLITPGTVDAEIYERCLRRIGVFEQALGGSEEILGEITREIKNIAENYELGEAERNSQLQQLADNKIRLIQEQESLEKQQADLFGIHLSGDQMDKEIADATSFWLSPASLHRLATLYLQRVCGSDQEFILGEKPLKTLRLSQDARATLLKDLRQTPKQKNNSIYREWENWLKSDKQHLPITFEFDCATEHPEAAFITPLHPLIRQAAQSLDTEKRVTANLSAVSDEIPPGYYGFAVYQWRFHGIREDLHLKPIASNNKVTEHLAHLLESAVDCSDEVPELDASVWDDLEAQHYSSWDSARTRHKQETRELIEYRRESLSASHQRRVAVLEERLRKATDERIQKMRRSEIAAARADYERQSQELDSAMDRADIIANSVAKGVIHISRGDTHAN